VNREQRRALARTNGHGKRGMPPPPGNAADIIRYEALMAFLGFTTLLGARWFIERDDIWDVHDPHNPRKVL
jgi:hypothetical protein